jgi:DMSO/TMAO reductase YedYZ molybdopterin-dependent catalytic subunit
VSIDEAGSANVDRRVSPELRPSLPPHPVPAERPSGIRIDGLVAHPVVVAGADLATLQRVELREPFACEEGWQTPPLGWSGVRLLDVLALATPRSDAPWVRVSSGGYAVPLALAEARDALLADTLNGEPLPPQHGAPWRLVVPGAACFTSVKWVDRLELAPQPGPPTGEAIARARLTPPPVPPIRLPVT